MFEARGLAASGPSIQASYGGKGIDR
jgi:hypothetical protein